VACAGATTSDVIGSQVSALSAATTLVSITIGGNDAGFSSVMETCVLSSTSTCLSAVAAAKAFAATQLPARLTSTLQAIRQHAPNARIVLLGYPDLYNLSRSSTCIGLSSHILAISSSYHPTASGQMLGYEPVFSRNTG
jgi:lysophospholipase L1-like esterase